MNGKVKLDKSAPKALTTRYTNTHSRFLLTTLSLGFDVDVSWGKLCFFCFDRAHQGVVVTMANEECWCNRPSSFRIAPQTLN